ncbi:MAG: RimK family alpha-L-glutamate ligase [Candidatus Paceibacterota bacterium]
MKKGWIIYNGNLANRPVFTSHVKWFIDTAKEHNILLEAKKNTDILYTLSNDVTTNSFKEYKPDFVIFFDKDVRLAQSLENLGVKVFNTSRAIEICDDKTLMHIVLAKNNIRTPRTILCPKAFRTFTESELGFLKDVASQLSLPLVIKEAFGSAGNEVYLIHTKEELIRKTIDLSPSPILFQEYIQESKGKDIRVYIVGGEFVGAVMRSNTNDWRANAPSGCTMTSYTPSEEEILLAQKACKAIGLDFAGVDILFGKDGPIVCEVNSNAHMQRFYEFTGIDVVRKIVEYVLLKV